jgi:TPR repeat protein
MLFRRAADAGIPEAQYALATLYKEGRGVPKDPAEAARLLGLASRAGNLDAQVEYAIAVFNGAGVVQDEAAAAALMRKAATRGSPIAQNRLARMLAAGRGTKEDPIAAARWHIVAKAGGVSDTWLDEFVARLSPADREAAEKAAKPWLDALALSRSRS